MGFRGQSGLKAYQLFVLLVPVHDSITLTYEEDFGFASCHSRRGGDLQLARRPQERPRGSPAVTTDPGQPDPLDLQQVRLHAHSPMVFVGSSMGERPGAPCTVDM